jgi:hypothetical protein
MMYVAGYVRETKTLRKLLAGTTKDSAGSYIYRDSGENTLEL